MPTIHTSMTLGPKLFLLPQMSGNGYYSYSPMNQQYGTQACVQTIVRIAQDHFRNTRTQIGIGDMSYADMRNFPPHHSHKDGKCVDIRPIGKNRMPAPLNISNPNYDHDNTMLLAEALMAHRNVLRVLFNDSRIPGVVHFAGHDNHLHVIMRT